MGNWRNIMRIKVVDNFTPLLSGASGTILKVKAGYFVHLDKDPEGVDRWFAEEELCPNLGSGIDN